MKKQTDQFAENNQSTPDNTATPTSDEKNASSQEQSSPSDDGEKGRDDWLELSSNLNGKDPAENLDSRVDDLYPDLSPSDKASLADQNWSTTSPKKNNGGGTDNYNIEAFVSKEITLIDHLTEQLNLSHLSPQERLIGTHLIDMVDEQGYLRGDLMTIATQIGVSLSLVEETLSKLQTFEPAGIFARDLKECMKLQLLELNHYDPAIACLLDNLHLLASHNFAALKKVCGVSDEDLADMINEVKSLNPKPGFQYGDVAVQPVVPDVFVRQSNDGAWRVELNSETLPKVLVNRSYYTTVSKVANSEKDKEYIQDCLQTANWLVKSLDQRARTILRVSKEIVRQQDGFFTYGVEHLRPLNLKTVADAISMHESTVSRVTSNKYIGTSRGIYELKYFFTSSIAASDSTEALSSEAVRYQIRQLIDDESSTKVLSDDKIVAILRNKGIDIARRTVAKYREAMGIASSVQRRRVKKMAAQMSL